MAVENDARGKEENASIRRTKALIDYLTIQIEAVEQEMREVMSQDPSVANNYALLTGITGIGMFNAILSIIHTDNFHAFETSRHYASYLGIAPFSKTLGTSVKGSPHVSTMRPKRLKADLTQAARVTSKHDREISEYMYRKTVGGKAYGVVLDAIKFKLVCRMFAVVRRQSKFVDLKEYVQAGN